MVGALVWGWGLGCAGGSGESETDAPALPSTGSVTQGPETTSSGDSTPDATESDPSTTTAPASESGTSGETCSMPTVWYEDADGDGYGNPFSPELACEAPPGHVDDVSDCDDTDEERYPGADEVCDGIDNDCDGLVDEYAPTNTSCGGCELAVDGASAYAFCPELLTFAEARAHCMSAFGTDLVKVDDDTENAFIMGAGLPDTGFNDWIGLSDAEVEGTFVWTDGSTPRFTAWAEGEPNDSGGLEDCAEMDVVSGLWNDVACDATRGFICEGPAG